MNGIGPSYRGCPNIRQSRKSDKSALIEDGVYLFSDSREFAGRRVDDKMNDGLRSRVIIGAGKSYVIYSRERDEARPFLLHVPHSIVQDRKTFAHESSPFVN